MRTTRRACVRGSALAAPGLLLLLLTGPAVGLGDEPGRFGRLFRFGAPPASPAPADAGPGEPPGAEFAPAATAPGSATAPQPRLVPQPRVSRAATEADPVVTRVAIGRSDEGTQFGMFLQVFADGTVIDSEGVHALGREAIKPILTALESGELYRLKGHCGAPSTDFVEQVHLIVFERSLGRLRANAFSFSGNPQGCDHAVKHLQTALDGLQAKLIRPATAGAGLPSPAASAPSAAPAARSGSAPAPLRLNDGLEPAPY